MIGIKKYMGWCIKGIRQKLKYLALPQRRLVLVALTTLISGCIMGNEVGRSIEAKQSEKKLEEAVAKVQQTAEDKLSLVEKQLYDLQGELKDNHVQYPWNLVLVNGSHPMEKGYVPKLKELQKGYSVDIRIVNAAKEMLDDAKQEGLHIQICSAYRSLQRQKQVFSKSMKDRVGAGMGYWDAYEETALNVAVPGTSEHALGLALDLISNKYTELDQRQETTEEAKWLKENCHKYGFILRYPPEKTNITGIVYEPWHYRYVGEEHATKIMELGITLEEYLQEHYQAEEGEE